MDYRHSRHHYHHLQDTYQWRDFGDIDGYVIVFSIIDRRSFNKAVQILDQIKWHSNSSKKTLILVANKNDLERSRLIGKQGQLSSVN